MNFYPAIDLKDGDCVRLYQGEMDKATVFSNSPAAQAVKFEEEGAKYLHIVDLNGAFDGKSTNEESVLSILDAVGIPVQLGGGIRSEENIKYWLDKGVARVIIGTLAVKQKDLVKSWCSKYKDKIVIGLDARGGKVATDGWAEDSGIDLIELAKEYEGSGAAAIIYTDIAMDGVMQGVSLDSTKNLAEAVNIPIIASGGVSNLQDLRKVKQLEEYGVEGIISGRAIYENSFTVKDAILVLE